MGIDVSESQNSINWSKVAASGIDFAMVRLGYRGYTEGKVQKDANYATNIKEAKAVPFSVYCHMAKSKPSVGVSLYSAYHRG